MADLNFGLLLELGPPARAGVVRGFACLVLVCAAALAQFPDAASADPFYGANVNAVWTYPPVQQQTLLDALAADGVRAARFDVGWTGVEPEPGVFDWTQTDLELSELARAGIVPDPTLLQSVSWDRLAITGLPAGTPVWNVAPADPLPFAAFAAAFARRYGLGGTFWTAGNDPVHDYEIWNEENYPGAYYPTSASGYAALYNVARAAVKAVDGSARVGMGGLAALWYSDSPGFGLDSYVTDVLEALGYCPDSVGYHAYPLTTAGLLAALRDFRAVLNTVGCTLTSIGLNEYADAGSDSAAAAVGASATELPAAQLGVDGMRPLPFVSTSAGAGPPALPPLMNSDGTLTDVGQAYSAVALADPVPVITWPAPTPSVVLGFPSPAGTDSLGSTVIAAQPAAPRDRHRSCERARHRRRRRRCVAVLRPLRPHRPHKIEHRFHH